jgi:hypothetical protein
MTLLEPLDLTGEIERLDGFPLTGGGFADVWRGVWNRGLEGQQVRANMTRNLEAKMHPYFALIS